MQICKNVYQIRIDFAVTEQVKRYVYVYLITGEQCYLVDSGVYGCEKIIEEYMKRLGRSIEEIGSIFFTHAHPDHVGGAAAIQRLSGCKIYASHKEQSWIEDVELQWKERPIPNFHTLVRESVLVDEIVKEGDCIQPEEHIRIQVLDTLGHSFGHTSYMYQEEGVIFLGDAMPDIHDFPIFVDVKMSEDTLKKLDGLEGIRFGCPAWDRFYQADEWKEIIGNAEHYLERFRKSVLQIEQDNGLGSEKDKLMKLRNLMGWNHMEINPLLKKSIEVIRNQNVSRLRDRQQR